MFHFSDIISLSESRENEPKNIYWKNKQQKEILRPNLRPITCSFFEICLGRVAQEGRTAVHLLSFLKGNRFLHVPQPNGWELKGDVPSKQEENEQSSRLMEMLARGTA